MTDERSRGALEAMVAALPVAVIACDGAMRILAASPAARALLGEPVVGLPCSSVIRHPAFLGALERALAGERPDPARFRLLRQGVQQVLVAHAVPVAPGADGGGSGGARALITFEDLSAIEQGDAIRRDFVANVSHELRTPLTALVGFIDTLRGPARDDPAARARFLAIMEREAGRMIRLVNDLLSLSRVEQEERRRPLAPVELAGLVRAAIQPLRPAAAEAGVELLVTGAPGPLTVPGDADQLTQVVQNLTENAIRYAGGARVTLELSRIAHEPALRGAAVQIAVRDRGAGIAAIHLPRLTERFYRVDAHRSREKGGTGLGLAIVKHIVARHRGRLRIESELGKGSDFMVILPEAANPPQA